MPTSVSALRTPVPTETRCASAISARMPPSPRLSACMISITYFTVTMSTSDQKISDRMPRTSVGRDRHAGEELQAGLEGVERAGADIAIDHAEHGEQHADRSGGCAAGGGGGTATARRQASPATVRSWVADERPCRPLSGQADAYAARPGGNKRAAGVGCQRTARVVNVAGMSDLTASSQDPSPAHSAGAGSSALGIAQLVLGVVAWFDVIAFTIAGVIFIGALVLVAGVFQVVHAFMDREWGGFALHLLIGVALRGRRLAADGRAFTGVAGDHDPGGGGAGHRRRPAHRHRHPAPSDAGVGDC